MSTSHHREIAINLNLFTAAIVAASVLSACSTMDMPASGQHAGMNADERCAMYRNATDGKTPSERRAAAEAHVAAMHGTVDAAHVDRHLRMMEQMCGAKPDAGAMNR